MADAVRAPGGAADRPLSPHLSIYRRGIHMMMSIVHRMTGTALYAGTLLLAAWLAAAAAGPAAYDKVNAIAASPPGLLVLFGYTWALLHHMLGGIRHLIWDTGRGFDLASVRRMSWGSLIVSIVLTLVLWGMVFGGTDLSGLGTAVKGFLK